MKNFALGLAAAGVFVTVVCFAATRLSWPVATFVKWMKLQRKAA